MIIECPACATRYELPGTAIGSEGRKVRCAKCRHSWHAVPADDEEVAAGAESEDFPVTDRAPTSERVSDTVNVGSEPSLGPGPEFADPALGLAVDALAEEQLRSPGAEQGRTVPPGAHLPSGGSRRLWLWAVAILAIMVAAVIAVTSWGLPEWVPGRTASFAAAPAELVLDFPDDRQGRRQLPNGTEIFGASGTITNAGGATRSVPPILIVLRDSRERIVYSWEVVPPKRSLAPGESVVVNEAVTDAPRSAHFADIGWKPG